MTLASQTNRQEYTCTGVTTYAIPFYFIQDADITVYRITAAGVASTLTLTADYTLTGAGDPDGGTLTTVATYSDGELVVTRDLDYTQGLDIVNGDGFRADTLELELDRVVMQIQQLSRKMGRAFTLADSDTSGASTLLPAPVGGSLIGWSADGTGLENTNSDSLATRVQASNFVADTFTAGTDFTSGVTTQLTLSTQPGTKTNAQIYFDGVRQSVTGFSLASDVITFDNPITATVVEVVTILAVTQGTAIINAGAVGTTEIADLAVTTDKLAANAVTAAKIAADTITSNEIAASAVTATELATDAVETVKIKNLAVTGAKIADATVTAGKLASSLMTTATDALAADVALTSANTYYSGPAVNLTAGVWLVVGSVALYGISSVNSYTAKLWNGASVASSIQSSSSSATTFTALSLSGIVTVTGAETWTIAAAATSTGGSMKAACSANGAGNNASSIFAVRLL